MTFKMMLSGWMALAMVAIAPLWSPPSAWAQAKPNGRMMQGMQMAQGGGAGMPQACREMMAMRQSMRAEQTSADAELNDLVAKMNAASGEQKVDAIAAVVSEMVAQRQARHEKMAEMRGKMAAAMANCPMMQDCPMMQKGAAPAEPGKNAE
jgi:hypothetical protein